MTNQPTIRKGRTRPFAVAIVFLVFSFASALSAVEGVRLQPQDEVAQIASKEGPLSIAELIRVALIASGTEASQIPLWTERIEEMAEDLPEVTGEAAVDGEGLLKWLHQNHLTRYREPQTRLDTLLDDGTYNCVSSAVIYFILARYQGLPVHGVLTTDHAFCRIPTSGDDGFDVETTTPFGFDPGSRKDAVESFTGRTGFRYVPPGNYRERRDIDGRELVSLIYQNRIAVLQRQGRWSETVGLARDRWVLAGTDAAAGDFRAAVTNYAAEADRTRRYREGLSVVLEAVDIFGDDHGLEQTASALLGNAVTRNLRAGRYDEARSYLDDDDLVRLVGAEFIAQRTRDIAIRELEDGVKSAGFPEATALVDDALDKGLIDRDRWGEFTLHLWSTRARSLSSGGRWLDGYLFLRDAPADNRELSGWERLEDSYRHNAVVDFHNRFSAAFRRGNFAEADAILEEAWELFPENEMLEQDRRALDRQSGS